MRFIILTLCPTGQKIYIKADAICTVCENITGDTTDITTHQESFSVYESIEDILDQIKMASYPVSIN